MFLFSRLFLHLQRPVMFRLFLFLLLVFLSCVPSRQMTQAEKRFDKQGHRGCRGLMPENIIAAMKKALDLGVTTLEMDAVITADGEVILSHEPFFSHDISTGPGGTPVKAAEEKGLNIFRMTYAQTTAYDVGLKPHPRFPQQQKIAATKPRLRDVIDSVRLYCNEKNIPFPQWNIETKSQPLTDGIYHPAPAEFVEKLVAVIKEKKIEAQTIIQSFDFRTLQYLHQHYPSLKTAMLIEDYDKRALEKQLEALGFVPTIYSPNYALVNEELVKACHNKGMLLIPWTVNNKEKMEQLIGLGVDGIITDYPDLFSQVALPSAEKIQ